MLVDSLLYGVLDVDDVDILEETPCEFALEQVDVPEHLKGGGVENDGIGLVGSETECLLDILISDYVD